MNAHRISPKASPSRRTSPKASPSRRTSLKASPGRISNTLQHLFEIDLKNSSDNTSSSPKLAKQSLLVSESDGILSTIAHCCVIYTFTDSSESPFEHDFKQDKLIQLLSIVKSSETTFPDYVLYSLVSMISANLFRPLPPSSSSTIVAYDLIDGEDISSSLSPMWQHLQIVYEILIRLVVKMDPKMLSDYINESFITNLLSLFQSEDPRERDSLKNAYHRIYSRFTFYRSFMRKSMHHVFLHYVFETERHCGIGELLEIWGSIINGFTVPLKEEHRLFLMRVLIPLHKTKGVQVYHRQLSYCVNQFVQKEPMLAGTVLRGILRYWPITNCQREVLLVGELEELVENIEPDHYRMLALPLCVQITKCTNSWNSQVAERALYVWNNEQFVKMASSAKDDVFVVVVEGIEKNLKWHWSKSVKQLTENVKEMLRDMDSTLYEKCIQQIDDKQNLARNQELIRKQIWERIELEASKNQFLYQQLSLCLSH